MLYFLMQDLQAVSHMYQLALSIYTRLFMQTLAAHKDEPGSPAGGTVLAAKIATLRQALVVLVYNYGARSLFKEDRLLMGLHVCMMLSPEEFPPDERDFFMNITTYVVDPSDTTHPGWIETDVLAAYQAMVKNIPGLHKKPNICDAEEGAWKQWIKGADPEAKLPGSADELPMFSRVCAIAVFRPDRLPVALEKLVVAILSPDSLNPPCTNLERIAARETLPTGPVLMNTTPGAVPS